MLGALLGAIAFGQAPEGLTGLEVTPEGFRASYDVTLHVRRDGNLFLEDELILDIDVERELTRLRGERGPDLRVVIAADREAPYSRIVEVLDLVQTVAGRVALEVGQAATPVDPLFPGAGAEVVNLDQQTFQDELLGARPKRWRFPQNPYGSTDFTAYTREWGETKIGLASISYGILPRAQIGTSPVLDAIGIYNGQAKVNFVREGPFDLALAGSLFVVPITGTLERFDRDGRYNIAGYRVKDDQIFVDRLTWYGLALQSSLQVVGGWSVHAALGYGHAGAKGNLDFQNLPVIALPGLDPIGGEVTLVPRVTGETLDLRFATDYRFNRRDSLVFQAAATVWGRARGEVSGRIEGVNLQGIKPGITYEQLIPLSESFRASLAYQFSWRRVDLRFGYGISAIPFTWVLQAFDLSYRFGGETRRTERTIKKGFREDKEELDIIEEIQFGAPEEAPPPEPN